MAATITQITVADDPQRWAALGFEPAGEDVQLGGVTLRLEPGGGSGITGWTLHGISSTQLDGLPTTRAAAPGAWRAGAHPNGVLRLDHVVAFTPDLDRSVGALQAAGLELRRVREEPTPAGAPRQAFFRLGEEILEVVQIPEQRIAELPGGRGAPARLWGLAMIAEDLDALAAQLGEHAGAVRPAVQPGRRILTLRRSAGLAVPLALMSAPSGDREQPRERAA